MRIDRRDHPAHRSIPAFRDSVTEQGVSGPGIAEQDERGTFATGDGVAARAIGQSASAAFDALKRDGKGFLKNVAAVFAAVGKARRDHRKSGFKTFD